MITEIERMRHYAVREDVADGLDGNRLATDGIAENEILVSGEGPMLFGTPSSVNSAVFFPRDPFSSPHLQHELLDAAASQATYSQAASASIIPDPGSPGIPANTSSTIIAHTDLSIAIGDTRFADALQFQTLSGFPLNADVLLFDNDGGGKISNAGTLWARSLVPDVLVAVGTNGKIENTGLIVSELQHSAFGIAYGVYLYGGADGTAARLENTGRIFAIGDDDGAVGVHSNNTGDLIVNDGLIAAQSGDGSGSTDDSVIGVDLLHGGVLINQSGGAILAESGKPIAISYGAGGAPPGGMPNISNAGLIEAASTNPDIPSIGIYVSKSEFGSFSIENSGIIRADIAIYIDSYAFSPPAKANDLIINEVGGEIDGVIFVDIGDDQLVNKGTVIGVVLMGEGNDSVDNGSGTIFGYSDLGFGDDNYIGSSGEDDVAGNRGDDHADGGAGQDLLLGGYGDDTLIGGAGSDGLYGEYGDDVIVATRGDFVSGGSGNDRIELGDFGGFAGIEGGADFDTLVLPSATRILDLSIARAATLMNGIDALAMGDNLALVVRAQDVAQLSDNNALVVQADATNSIYLVGSWTEGAQSVVNGVTYRDFDAGLNHLLVQLGAHISIGVSGPGGAAGFDSAPGIQPPIPNPDFFASDVTSISDYAPNYSFTVYEGETWQSPDGDPVFRSADLNISLTNYGTIVNDHPFGPIRTLLITNIKELWNYGTISAHARGVFDYAIATEITDWGLFYNAGLVSAVSDHSYSYGVIDYDANFTNSTTPFINDGTIYAQADQQSPLGSEQNMAVGIFIENDNPITNNGTIQAVGDRAAGVVIALGGTLLNAGQITATSLNHNSFGIVAAGMNLVNSGTITGDTAVYTNDGGIDTIQNSGTLVGAIVLLGGDDIYDSHNGHQRGGTVFGGDGNDTLTGGIDSEVFDGGTGNDKIYGGGGTDTASFGDATSGVTVSLLIASAQAVGGGLGSNTLTSIENLEGSAFADHLTGNADANTLIGGAGNDTLDGGTGVDTADDSAATSAITVNLALTTAQAVGGGLGSDTFVSIENVIGSVFDDVLTGNASANVLTGANGNDTLAGGAGDDTLDGGAGNDTADYSAATSAVTVSLAITTAQAVGGGQGSDTLVAIENLTGSASSDKLTGDGGDNVLKGGSGNDTLDGGTGGNDVIYGGDGNDTILPGGGTDTVYGGDGDDKFNFGANLTNGDIVNGDAGNDTVELGGDYTFVFGAGALLGVEAVRLDTGHNYNLTFDDANVAAGTRLTVGGAAVSSGNSVIIDGSHETDGSFSLLGGGGADQLTGGALDDSIAAGAGNDILFGGGGNDTLRGALGADTITGGDGADTYLYQSVADSSHDTYDTIIGFDTGFDHFDLSTAVTGIDATIKTGKLRSAHFDKDMQKLANAAHLHAGSAVLVSAKSGDLAHDVFLLVDMNGVAGYQAGHDLVLHLEGGVHLTALTTAAFT